jgi:hypothetical protein
MLVITVEGKSQQPWIRPLHQWRRDGSKGKEIRMVVEERDDKFQLWLQKPTTAPKSEACLTYLPLVRNCGRKYTT